MTSPAPDQSDWLAVDRAGLLTEAGVPDDHVVFTTTLSARLQQVFTTAGELGAGEVAVSVPMEIVVSAAKLIERAATSHT